MNLCSYGFGQRICFSFKLFSRVFFLFVIVKSRFAFFLHFFESRLIPILFLILGLGYQLERVQVGIYLLFDTLLASLPLLVGILSVYSSLGSLWLFLLCGNDVLVGGYFMFVWFMPFWLGVSNKLFYPLNYLY